MPYLAGPQIGSELQELVFKGLLDSIPRIRELIRLRSLDERERRVIKLYFGLDGLEALNLEQIGALMGVTRERIRQIKEKAFGKLRHPRFAQALKALVREI